MIKTLFVFNVKQIFIVLVQINNVKTAIIKQ